MEGNLCTCHGLLHAYCPENRKVPEEECEDTCEGKSCHCHHKNERPLPCWEIKRHQLKCSHCNKPNSLRDLIINNPKAKERIALKKSKHDAKDKCSNPYCLYCKPTGTQGIK